MMQLCVEDWAFYSTRRDRFLYTVSGLNNPTSNPWYGFHTFPTSNPWYGFHTHPTSTRYGWRSNIRIADGLVMLRYDPAALADPYLIYHFEKGGEYTFTDFITMSKRLCQFFERFKSLDQIMLVPPTSEGYGDFTRAVHWEHMYDMIVNEYKNIRENTDD